MKFIKCTVYLVFTGICSFILGWIIPKNLFNAESFPYKLFGFEKNGQIYERIKIKRWQNLVPDMSKIRTKIMPPKKLSMDSIVKLPLMIQETCVAEFIHVLLCVTGIYCVWLWPGIGGAVVAGLYFLGNLLFVFIQRYNRPRLLRQQEKRTSRVTDIAVMCS